MHGIILAGGSGSRLWPLSRDLYPKQLLKLNSDRSLLQKTYERLMGIVDIDNIVAITSSKHFSNVKMQLKEYNQDIKVLAEPEAKNTAPAIAVATKYIMDFVGDEIIVVVPSDHLIKDVEKFRKTIENAKALAEKDYIVTLGITPYCASNGFGYIKTGEKIDNGYKVVKFVEKPDTKTAQTYCDSKEYYWNCGILVFKASVFMKSLEQCSKLIYDLVQKFDFRYQDEIDYVKFVKFPNISIDYALIENSPNVAMVEMLCDWNDLGSWHAVYNSNNKDENNNVKIGNVIAKNCKNSMLYSSSRTVAGVGLEDIFVVETTDAVLACNKNDVEGVKEVFDMLKESNTDSHRPQTTVYRPWGYYTVLNQGEGYLTKMIAVASKGQLSLQSHNHRCEHWVVLCGVARVTLNDKIFMLKAGQSIDIPRKAIHSLANPYESELRIIEVQKGDKLSEEDIIRYKDIYGRITK